MERARAWAEAKSKDNAEISRFNAEAREKERAEDKARVRKKSNSVQRAALEARRGRGRIQIIQGG